MQAADHALNPLRERFDLYLDYAQGHTAEPAEHQINETNTEIEMNVVKDDIELHHGARFIENGIIEGPLLIEGPFHHWKVNQVKERKRREKGE